MGVGRKWSTVLIGVAIGAFAASAGAAAPGDVVITEIMQNPGAVGDSPGEWFELYNESGAPVDRNGWTIGDGAGERLAPAA